MSASDNTNVIDATRTVLRALEDNSEGLEAIWRCCYQRPDTGYDKFARAGPGVSGRRPISATCKRRCS